MFQNRTKDVANFSKVKALNCGFNSLHFVEKIFITIFIKT